MAYPSILSTYTDPSPNDRLSTTPHSSIETAQNTGLREIQAFVGTLSSNVGTLVYDIRGANSDGGGHVQTADKGGTGQTSYTKGNVLVATGATALTKLAVGNDGDILTADSSVASGVKWNPGVNSQAIQNMQFSHATETGTGSVYTISPVPCVLSYTTGQLFTFSANTTNTVASPTLRVSSLAGKIIKNPDGTSLSVGQIKASALTMVQYEGSSSVFQVLSTKGNALSSVKNGVTNKTTSDASTTQNIAHGLGVTPRYVRIDAIGVQGTANVAWEAHTTYNGTTQSSISHYGSGTNGNNADQTFTLSVQGTTPYKQVGVVTFDATNIVITWTGTGSDTAVDFQLLWSAFA